MAEEGSKEITALQSLVEAEADGQGQQEGVVAAIQRTATSAAAFYQQVQAWQRIPQAFASMEDDERELVASLSLRRWLNAELGRPGVLPGDDQLDEELVEYVAGLLDHPDFCQPDLLVLELHEFLGSNVNKIVLALWKFMIVEIGLRSVFKLETTKTVNKIQVESSGTSRAASPSAELTNAQPQSSDATAERDYKRRRASYRGKVGTKIGPAAYREMIQKHMIGLSLEMDRELVLGGGFRDVDDGVNGPSKTLSARSLAVDWRDSTDALEVRNRSRRQDKRSSRTRHSKSRSRSRGRSSSRKRSPVRHSRRRRSRSRDRSSRRQDRNHSTRRRSRRSLSKNRESRRDRL